MDIDFGRFADAIHFGDYPELLKKVYPQYIKPFRCASHAP
mgnify:CR=1 FL=1